MKFKKYIIPFFAILAVVIFFSACDVVKEVSGLAPTPGETNRIPTANAGPDLMADVGDTVILNGTDSEDLDNDPITYLWEFIYKPVNPVASVAAIFNETGSIAYFIPDVGGVYFVKLTVSDGKDSHSDEVQITVTAPDSDPVAVITYNPPAVNQGTTVFFDGNGSNDPDGGAIQSWSWSFGDGDSSSSPQPSHVYSSGGTYTVQLTVTDDEGATNTATISINVNSPPVASFTATPTSGNAPLSVSFEASGSTDDGTITDYSWNFGDGEIGSGVSLGHTFSNAGSYTVQLTVTDDGLLTDSATLIINASAVGNDPPTADIQYTPPVYQGASVSFDSSGSSDDVEIVGYSWNFGDGGSSTSANPSHTFNDDGMYTVSLTVTDGGGLTGTAIVSVTVLNQNPTASISYSPATIYEGTTVTFSSTGSTDPDGSIVSGSWSFGDGNTGSGVTTTHIYSSDGTYTVGLTVTDDDGGVGTATKTVTVLATPNQVPIADAGSDKVVSRGEIVSFDGSNSYDPDDGYNLSSYSWDFGDGSTGSGTNPTHVYSAAGVFNVILTVTDSDGASDTDTAIVTVGGGLLVSQAGAGYPVGYGTDRWGNMTAALDDAFNNAVTVVPNLEDLKMMLSFDALWVDQRYGGSLTPTEVNNISTFISNGGKVVMIGENDSWAVWNNQILEIVGGSYAGALASGNRTSVYSHELTSGAATIYVPAGGLANGGTSLYDQNFATLWGAGETVLTILDVNLMEDNYWNNQNNSAFANNVAEWIGKPAVAETFLDLTPASGNIYEDYVVEWANKGYSFTATQSFTIKAAEYYLNLPSSGYIQARVYNNAGAVLAVGTAASGNDAEQWYRSNITFAFQAGQEYTVSFFCNVPDEATIDYKSASPGYSVDGMVSNVYHWAGGGDTPAYPNLGNAWYSFQRLVSSAGGKTVVAIGESNYSNTLEHDGLYTSLVSLGFDVVDAATVDEAEAAGADVIIAYIGSSKFNVAQLDAWISGGKGFIQIGDWTRWFTMSYEGIGSANSVEVNITNPGHPIAAGLSASWTGLGFWEYGLTSDYVGWAIGYTSIGSVQASEYSQHTEGISATEYGTGRAVFFGINVYGSAAGPNELRLLENAVNWVK